MFIRTTLESKCCVRRLGGLLTQLKSIQEGDRNFFSGHEERSCWVKVCLWLAKQHKNLRFSGLVLESIRNSDRAFPKQSDNARPSGRWELPVSVSPRASETTDY